MFNIQESYNSTPSFIAIPRLRLMLSNIQPNRQAKPNQVQNEERETKRDVEGGGGATMCINILLPSKVQGVA